MRRRFIIFILAVIIIGGIFSWVFYSFFRPETKGRLEIGSAAPDFKLPDINGLNVRLSDFRGKVILLNFWATWCPPCREEIPSMQSLYEKLNNNGLEIIAVSIDKKGKEAVTPFVKNHQMTFRVLLDPEQEISTTYGVNAIPESFILDKEGKIVNKVTGALNWMEEASIKYFEKLLSN